MGYVASLTELSEPVNEQEIEDALNESDTEFFSCLVYNLMHKTLYDMKRWSLKRGRSPL